MAKSKATMPLHKKIATGGKATKPVKQGLKKK